MHTLFVHSDPCGGSHVLAEVLSTERNAVVYRDAMQALESELAKINKAMPTDPARRLASPKLMPTFVVTDHDNALLNGLSLALNGMKYVCSASHYDPCAVWRIYGALHSPNACLPPCYILPSPYDVSLPCLPWPRTVPYQFFLFCSLPHTPILATLRTNFFFASCTLV